MWKAAHVALTKWLVSKEEFKDLSRHKTAFLVGSILPDCMPSFVTKRHRLEDTFSILKKEIQKLQRHRRTDFYFCLHLGIVLHYIADYFTYPHNKPFHGNFLEHCIWEKNQQQYLTKYLQKLTSPTIVLSEDFYSYLLEKHREYLKKGGSLKNDCKYATQVTYYFAVMFIQAIKSN